MDEYQLEFATELGESYLNCPACNKEMIAGHSECFSCGVIVQRFKSTQSLRKTKDIVGGIEHLSQEDFKRLDKAWKKVVVNYHDKATHENFLKQCYEHRALPFAIHHYSKMLEIDKEDDIADLMRRQALSTVSIGFENKVSDIGESKVETRGLPFLKWVNWAGLFFSSFCIVTGLATPGARNLVGLGASFLVLFIALSIYRRR
mgnify:CR=1 FL=1